MSQQKTFVNLTAIDTTPQHTLGELYIDSKGNHYRYLQADGAVVAKNLYSFVPGTWQIDAPLDVGTTPGDGESVPLCVWDGSDTDLADEEYAWVFVGPGTFSTITAAGVTAKAICYGHATAGLIDDAATATLLRGVHAPTTIGSATEGTFYAAHELYATDLP